MATNVILARMGEVTLKGLNRGRFEAQLMNNLRYRLRSFGKVSIFQSQSRIWIESKEEGNPYFETEESAKELMTAVTQVFGIVSVSLARKFQGDINDIDRNAEEYVKNLLAANPSYKTFKVECKRGNKKFPMNSPMICEEVGAWILEHFENLSVDVHNPDFILHVEVRDDNYVYAGKMMGHRGLPVGTAGKGMLLLSGGIDSPVAGYMMASRGMPIDAVYFHAPPYTSERAKQKVVDLAEIVARYSGPIRLHVVNFTDIQLAIYDKCPHDELTIIMRRYMMRIAEYFARKSNCQALITGESIGQVASQTIQSLVCTDEVCTMPVFRPVIGFDKQEIIDRSLKIGTYDISIQPFEDCCTIFVAKHPVTKPHLDIIQKSEKKLDDVIDGLMKEALETTELIEID